MQHIVEEMVALTKKTSHEPEAWVLEALARTAWALANYALAKGASTEAGTAGAHFLAEWQRFKTDAQFAQQSLNVAYQQARCGKYPCLSPDESFLMLQQALDAVHLAALYDLLFCEGESERELDWEPIQV